MSATLITSLKERWLQSRQQQPHLRIRDAAAQWQTTEAEILASFTGEGVTRLNDDFRGLITRMPELGRVMCLTRNEYCVHERKGKFEEISVASPHVGLVTGPDIDLRLFFKPWAFAFAVAERQDAGFKTSFQVFDHQGRAVLKIYPQETAALPAFEKIRTDFTAGDRQLPLALQPAPAPEQYEDDRVDIQLFQQDWAALKDTHDFFPLLRKHKISRKKALHIGGDFTRKLSNDAVVNMLEKASAEHWEIMAFVGNHGNIQIHSGPVDKIVPIPGWINVMDPDFNLHLKLEGIDECWYVVKPTVDGPVHSLEVLDKNGDMIVQFFGRRKPGQPERAEWTNGLARLAAESGIG